MQVSQQGSDISTPRASLVVHNFPESSGFDIANALQQAFSRCPTVRL